MLLIKTPNLHVFNYYILRDYMNKLTVGKRLILLPPPSPLDVSLNGLVMDEDIRFGRKFTLRHFYSFFFFF